jgi:hypothetical protein
VWGYYIIRLATLCICVYIHAGLCDLCHSMKLCVHVLVIRCLREDDHDDDGDDNDDDDNDVLTVTVMTLTCMGVFSICTTCASSSGSISL